uniref:Uncharacterized protein n=1 Tax=Oryza brachyantha TaxID=4533 RepID=J3ME68_ORYBR
MHFNQLEIYNSSATISNHGYVMSLNKKTFETQNCLTGLVQDDCLFIKKSNNMTPEL